MKYDNDTEKKVRELYAQGLEYQEIAHELEKSPSHIQNVLSWAGLTDRNIKSENYDVVIERVCAGENPEDIAVYYGIQIETVLHWVNCALGDCAKYEVVDDPSYTMQKGHLLTGTDVFATLQIGNWSNGTILKDVNTNKFYKIEVKSKMVEVK